jgi:3-hydroxyacyl-[acyl-carrier-protein] dehydratase
LPSGAKRKKILVEGREHDVRFHLIDKVEAVEPGKSIRGRKLTSLSEDYWEDSDDGPVMPYPFVLEALCQAGTWLVMITTERRKRAALLSIGSVEFLDDVHPGDVLDLDGTVDSMSDEVAVVSGRVTVDGRPILGATDIMCALIDAEDLADLDDTERLQNMLTRAGAS